MLKLKRKIFARVYVVRFVIVAVTLLVIFLSGRLFYGLTRDAMPLKVISAIGDFVLPDFRKLNIIDNRINILVLGKGGGEHQAPDLTDSIMLISISFDENKIDLLSLPRDIWIAPLRTKLNNVYYWGNQKHDQGGLIMAKSTVEEIIGMPVQYGVVVDFQALVKVVDLIGGIKVDVKNSFVDNKYPVAGRENDDCDNDPDYACRYETVSFERGEVLMDGQTVLKYVRSRNAQGDEGTDIARSMRQQAVILAIKERILSKDVLFSPTTIKSLAKIYSDNFESDIGFEKASVLARAVFNLRDSVVSYNFPIDLFFVPDKSPGYDNLYVFVPEDESWQDLHVWIKENL